MEPGVKSRRIVLGCAVAATAVLVHAPALWYPFIQDDWIALDEVLGPNRLGAVVDAFSPFTKAEFRPLGTLYFFVLAHVFGANPVVSHAFMLALHAASSLLVVGVLLGITGDEVGAWAGGVLYAAAASVHLDPMLWASGIFDSGSVFFTLLCFWLFINDRIVASVAALVAALLFKEAAAFAPLVVCALAWSRSRFVRSWPFLVVIAIYAALKIASAPPTALPDNDPYVVRFTGPHVVRNVLTYGRWSIEAVAPWHRVPSAAAVSIFLVVGIVLGVGVAKAEKRPETACLAVWAAGSAALFLFLPNHVYRYYLTPALPAVLGLIVVALRELCAWARVQPRACASAFALLAGASAISSFQYFRGIDRRGAAQEAIEGTNDLVRRAPVVTMVRRRVLAAHPSLPPRSVLLFKGVDVWAFGKDSGPTVWYRDPTLRAYDARDASRDGDRWVVNSPAENLLEVATQAPARRIPLDCCPVFLFDFTDPRR